MPSDFEDGNAGVGRDCTRHSGVCPSNTPSLFWKCAWGISISTWVIWLVAGALLLSYCIFRNDTLFAIVQVINITAIVATIMLARRSDRICPYHNTALKVVRAPKNNESVLLQKGILCREHK